MEGRSFSLSLSLQEGRSSSIFGSARPVDTAAREKEIEERMLKEKERKEVGDFPITIGMM